MRLDNLTPLAQSVSQRPPSQGLVLAVIVGATTVVCWVVRTSIRRVAVESREDGRQAGMVEGFDLGCQTILAEAGVTPLSRRRGRRRD